jgi:hypothetical protein
MHFLAIWTMPATALSERLRRTRDWAANLVVSMLPLRIRYWTTLREIGKAVADSENVPATPLNEILSSLEIPKGL